MLGNRNVKCYCLWMLCVTRIYLEHLERLCWRTTSDVIVGVVRKQSVTYDVNQNRKSTMYGKRPERTVWVRIGLHYPFLLDVLKIARREQEMSRTCIQSENVEDLSSFDGLTVMDRHPLRKKRKLKREHPDSLGGTTSVLYYMESFGYVRLLLTKTFAKTLINSEKKKEGNPHGYPRLIELKGFIFEIWYSFFKFVTKSCKR